jgi:hypothetical protein
VSGLPLRRRKCEQGHACGDREHRDSVAGVDVLAEPPDRDRKQEDEACSKQRLHQGERRVRERKGLQRPADKAQRSARDPAPTRDEPTKEGKTQSLPRRRDAGLERLQHDSDGVERGGAQGGDDSRQDARHDCRAP